MAVPKEVVPVKIAAIIFCFFWLIFVLWSSIYPGRGRLITGGLNFFF
jgi:hypothetical protein